MTLMTSIFSFGKIPQLDNKKIAVQILQRVLWEKMAQSCHISRKKELKLSEYSGDPKHFYFTP
jgi:hypothetical protein